MGERMKNQTVAAGNCDVSLFLARQLVLDLLSVRGDFRPQSALYRPSLLAFAALGLSGMKVEISDTGGLHGLNEFAVVCSGTYTEASNFSEAERIALLLEAHRNLFTAPE